MRVIQQKNCKNTWLKQPLRSQHYRRWLVDNGSLTARLQQKFADFAVKPVNLSYAKPLQDEVALLQHKPQQCALIREVLLLGNQNPVVFAHSVLPSNALRGAWNKLGRLGNKPLGATLFANPKVQRTPLEYKKLSRNHPLLRRVNHRLSANFDHLWARRSTFSLKCARILVTEIFLPRILK